VATYAAAHGIAMAAAAEHAAVTPALIDDLHRRLCGAEQDDSADHATDAALDRLCRWLAAPPDELHPVVVAVLGHLELLRMHRWPDGNARLARLVLLVLLSRSGYGYDGLLAPSATWRDPGKPLDHSVEELSPDQAETHPAVAALVHGLSRAVRDVVAWVRAENSFGPAGIPGPSFPG
jgi:hypothetical protein